MWTAAVVAAGYIVVCNLYIWLSSAVVAQIAKTPEDISRLEMEKGYVFICTTGLLAFAVAWRMLRRVARDQRELLRRRDALISAERRAMAGTLAASVAHDINNISMVLETQAGILEGADTAPAADRQQARNSMRAALRNLSNLAQQLMHVGREGVPGEFEEAELDGVIRETLFLCRAHTHIRGCRLQPPEPATGIRMRINARAFGQMLFNLVLNAAEATEQQGTLAIRTRTQDGQLILEVHDNGTGIPADRLPHLFDPFYTTKPDGNGLGLISVKACAELHGGTVAVTRSDLGGACFRVTLPLVRAGAPV